MSAPSLQPGMLIAGKYRLGRLLGQGGMGSVFAAENMATGKQVAIKCMHRQFARTPDAAERFLREAKASARIRHPNVVDFYDVLAENDTFYLVMELLEGEPLSAFLARETTTLPQLIKVVLGAMRGVAAAHREGVIHRDIKPENIFLAREGYEHEIVAKVLDFGISRTQGAGIPAPGQPLGTVTYMSMEQLAGAPDVDGRADIYAFGVILYQAITGQPPFEAETYPALILRVMTEQATPIKLVRPDVPLALCALVESAMAKQRDLRIPNLEVFIAQLAPFAEAASFDRKPPLTSKLPPSPRPPRGNTTLLLSSAPPRAPRRALLHPAFMALGAFGLAVAVWWMLSPASERTRVKGLGANATTAHVVVPAPPAAHGGDVTLAAAAAPERATPEPVVPSIEHAPVVAAPQQNAPLRPLAPDSPSRTADAPVAGTARDAADAPLQAAALTASAPPPPTAAAPPTESTPPAAARAALIAMPKAALRTQQPSPQSTRHQPARPARQSASAAASGKRDCNPNFIFDAQGEKHFKPECF